MKMIEHLREFESTSLETLPEHHNRREIHFKINEIIDVVNALIDGDFPNSMDRTDFRLKLAENLRKAQSKVKD